LQQAGQHIALAEDLPKEVFKDVFRFCEKIITKSFVKNKLVKKTGVKLSYLKIKSQGLFGSKIKRSC
jgi:hypothetical protein